MPLVKYIKIFPRRKVIFCCYTKYVWLSTNMKSDIYSIKIAFIRAFCKLSWNKLVSCYFQTLHKSCKNLKYDIHTSTDAIISIWSEIADVKCSFILKLLRIKLSRNSFRMTFYIMLSTKLLSKKYIPFLQLKTVGTSKIKS